MLRSRYSAEPSRELAVELDLSSTTFLALHMLFQLPGRLWR